MDRIRSLTSILLFLILTVFFAVTVFLGLQNQPTVFPVVLIAAVFIACCALLPIKTSSKTYRPLQDYKTLTFLGLLTVLPRALWLAGVHPVQVSDFKFYHRLATALADSAIRYQAYLRLFPHALGYPFVLSGLYRLFGSHVWVAQVFNIVLFVGIVLVIFLLAGQFMDRRFAILAALIVALWPSQLFYSTLVSTEALFTLLLLSCIGLFYAIRNSSRLLPGIAQFTALGVLAALTNAIRPFGFLFLIAVFIYYFVFSPLVSGGVKPRLFKLVFYACVCCGYLLTSSFVHYLTVRTVQGNVARSFLGYSILVGANVEAGGTWNQGDSNLQGSLYQDGKVNPDQVNRILMGYALKRIASSPVAFLKLQLPKNRSMWQNDRYGIYWNKTFLDEANPGFINSNLLEKLNPISDIYYFVILICCILGSLLGAWKRESGLMALVGLIILGTILIFVFTEVQERYHYYMLPLFALLAVYGLYELNQFYRKPRQSKKLKS
jgi:4-amino-4-deoxy-L-arabinose transferase-like glycosyltransferase